MLLCCEDWHNILLADPEEPAEKAEQGFFYRNSSVGGNKNILKTVTLLMVDPVAWFQLADAVFNRLHVQGSRLRYEHVLMSLPPEVLERVRGEIGRAHV